QPDRVIFRPGQTLELTGKNPWIKPDTDPSLEQRHAPADNIVEAVDSNQSFVNLAHARVRYSTTNPSVATVSPSGKLRAVSVGVTAVNVTVDGVTGSTPIVVQQPLKITGGDAGMHTATTRPSNTTTSSNARSAGARSSSKHSATASHPAAKRPKVAVTVGSRSAAHGRSMVTAGPARTGRVASPASNDSAQRIVAPGSTFTASATLRDPRGAAPLKNVRLRLVAPRDWLVEPISPTRFARVNPGHSATTRWHVTVPSSARGGVKTLTVVANFRSASGPADATA